METKLLMDSEIEALNKLSSRKKRLLRRKSWYYKKGIQLAEQHKRQKTIEIEEYITAVK